MQGNMGDSRFIKGLSRSIGLFLAFVVVLNGCSDVPDAANPAEWYKSTVDLFSGDKQPTQKAEAADADQGKLAADRDKPAPGAEKPFPNLSSVPQGLGGDRQKRKYSSEALPRQGAPSEVLGSEPAAPPPPPAISDVSDASSPKFEPAPSMVAPKLKPPSALAPGQAEQAPPSGGGLHETYMARLSQRLPIAGGLGDAAVEAPDQNDGAFPLSAPETESTVVISSSGVDAGGAAPSAEPVKPLVMLKQPKQIEDEASSGVVSSEDGAAPLSEGLPSSSGAALPTGAVKIATILFDNGSNELKNQAQSVLGKVFQIYRQEGGRVRIIGHSSSRTRNMDQVKHKMINYQLSAGRADAVARELIRLGVPADSVFVDARADADPMYYEIMPSGEAGNRRAEVYFER
ncbi:MAG: hypothetical protein A3G18_04470 [Rhodospirillales bacterium RIFCSPLOWO2_12_FULL_58_28]|nr:MAG: hypothetical protein A3H92_09825 [Rhodospirillales bacterium RIFCSPLOWO2_02_FULL_58_16]OHC76900.1 MAG: hypothetical protein A3G18_04470 [Rhodospirillales bacterium RIFCSPLOWO2_12_FULL_58_28]